ncbi:MAG: acetyltransferase [Bacteroidia bacterium]
MIIFGAGGFAKQLIPSLERLGVLQLCVFYDDVSDGSNSFIHQNFKVLKTEEALSAEIAKGNDEFVIALGNPATRKSMYEKAIGFNAKPRSIVDSQTSISNFGLDLGEGVVILEDVIIEPCNSIGKGTLLNLRVMVTHDCRVGNFCEISPGSMLLGGCEVGDNTFVGAGSIILPKVKVGKNCVIGAGSVVNKNLPDHSHVAGAPAKPLHLK